MLTFPRPPLPARDREVEQSARDPLLVTKLQLPPAPLDLVPRPHLADRIEPIDNQQLAILCAPTGFGKTTALREWSERSSRRVAWLSLDQGDNDPTRFWQYVIAALEVWEPGIGTHPLSLLRMVEPITLEYVVTSIVNELACQPTRYALVLDDYHVITDPAIHRSLRYLLDHLPAQLRLVIASRVDPPLGLPRLRAQGGLIELRGPDLRFTTDEATTFLIDALGLALETDDVLRLERRTEGWIAGLRLAGTALRQAGDPRAFIERFNGQHRSIGDYLAGEVLDQQPPDVQRFLLETSILDRLSGPLCDA
ncbi:MAG: helix-turn-helix transcriptional regulator, partial [Vicinamibacterales bacterium]